jgi:septal ring factor EnvC (AmiA/AmiB activator)
VISILSIEDDLTCTPPVLPLLLLQTEQRAATGAAMLWSKMQATRQRKAQIEEEREGVRMAAVVAAAAQAQGRLAEVAQEKAAVMEQRKQAYQARRERMAARLTEVEQQKEGKREAAAAALRAQQRQDAEAEADRARRVGGPRAHAHA